MSDRVLVPLPDGRWLALTCEAFQDALKAGSALIAAPESSAVASASDAEPLLDAVELSRALNLPKSCVYEKARTGSIPSVRVGKHLRFRRSQVLAALGATASVAVGRS